MIGTHGWGFDQTLVEVLLHFPLMLFLHGIISSQLSWLAFADVQREEKSVEKAIREAAKRNDMGSAKVCLFVILLFSCKHTSVFVVHL
jgi:uncharacterized membrane protein (DUF4010 family)